MKRLAERQSVAEEEKDLLTRCRNALESIDPSVEVILYGSRARGDPEPESALAGQGSSILWCRLSLQYFPIT